jgi:hypothetical protein
MRVTDQSRTEATIAHLQIVSLEIQTANHCQRTPSPKVGRTHCRSMPSESWHVFSRTLDFTAVWGHRSRYSLSVIFAPSKSRPKSTFAQLPLKVGLRFPHVAVDSIVVFAFAGLVIATEIHRDEPSAVATCNDLANIASHSVPSLARKERHTSRTQAGPRSTYWYVGANRNG